jgi:BR serine/threonine kinase
MKVKSGVFQMGPFSDDARDLISRLIVVDPSRRLTIPQIKEHPYFRRNLPGEYILPRPLPIPAFSEPIDPGTISEEVVDVLRKIGYTDDNELLHDFESPQHSMAKVFYRMLTSRDKFDRLDWSQSLNGNGGFGIHTDDDFIIAPGHGEIDMFGGEKIACDGSLSAMSLGTRPEWAVPESVAMVGSIVCELVANLPLVEALRAMQMLMGQLEMQWFHPDDYSIIARQQTQGLCVLVDFMNSPDDSHTTAVIRLGYGGVEAFNCVVAGAEELLQTSARYVGGIA